MMAYKAFNGKLQATMGKGIFQFEPGGTYEEKECKCAKTGFHCAENPLCVLQYYDNDDTRFFIVKAEGDINQDGVGSRISCTKITLVKEIDRIKLAVHACLYIQKYPQRDTESNYVKENKGRCSRAGNFVIVTGESPEAAGVKGSYLFLLKRKRKSNEVEGIYPVFIDGKEYQAGIWYKIKGGRVCEKKN